MGLTGAIPQSLVAESNLRNIFLEVATASTVADAVTTPGFQSGADFRSIARRFLPCPYHSHTGITRCPNEAAQGDLHQCRRHLLGATHRHAPDHRQAAVGDGPVAAARVQFVEDRGDVEDGGIGEPAVSRVSVQDDVGHGCATQHQQLEPPFALA